MFFFFFNYSLVYYSVGVI